MLSGFAVEGGPVTHLAWSDLAAPSGLEAHRAWRAGLAGGEACPEARASYDELLAGATALATAHDVVVTVTVSRERLAGRGRDDGAGTRLAKAVASSVEALGRAGRSAGLDVGDPLGAAELRRALRTRCDPAAAAPAAAGGRLVDRLGLVGPAGAGPVALEASWRHVRVDGAFHRTYEVAAWPRLAQAPGWLEPFLAGAGVIRTTTVVFRPVPAHQSRRRIERDLVKLDSDAATKEDKGRRVDTRGDGFEMIVDGMRHHSRGDAGHHLRRVLADVLAGRRSSGDAPVGQLGGFEVRAVLDAGAEQLIVALDGIEDHVRWAPEEMLTAEPPVIVRRLERRLQALDGVLAAAAAEQRSARSEADRARSRLGAAFPFDDALRKASRRQPEIDASLLGADEPARPERSHAERMAARMAPFDGASPDHRSRLPKSPRRVGRRSISSDLPIRAPKVNPVRCQRFIVSAWTPRPMVPDQSSQEGIAESGSRTSAITKSSYSTPSARHSMSSSCRGKLPWSASHSKQPLAM